MEPVNRDELMRYLDGEAAPEERERIEARLAKSSELSRELSIYRAMREDFRDLSFAAGPSMASVWDRVNRKLTRPIGWILLVVGLGIWSAYGLYLFFATHPDPWQQLAAGAIVIGILLLTASVIWDRYREWLSDPYRDVHR